MTIVAILLGIGIFAVCMLLFTSFGLSEWTSIILASVVIGLVQPVIRDDVSLEAIGLTFIGCLLGASLVRLALGPVTRKE